jgi:DNA polymerase-1
LFTFFAWCSVKEECHKNKYVLTIGGRHRKLPGIVSRNASARSAAERQAVNTMVQGSAADMMKLAMVRLDAALLQPEFTDSARLVLMVHVRTRIKSEFETKTEPQQVATRRFRVGETLLRVILLYDDGEV